MFDVNDLIYDLANVNQEELTYFDFKDEIHKRWSYEVYDNDEVGDLFSMYKEQRRKACEKATEFLKKLIDEDKTGVRKNSVGDLFKLASFRDRSYLVNQNEIWVEYVKHVRNKEKEMKGKGEGLVLTSHVNSPKQPKQKPKPKLDLNPAKAFIYDELIESGHELITKDEMLTYLLNEHPLYASAYGKLYTQYKKDYNRYHRHDPVQPATTPNITLPYPFRSKINEYYDNKLKLIIPENVKMSEEVRDKNAKIMKNQFSRPSFAIEPYSWEIDHLQYDKNKVTYLFCLNINTRYLYVIVVNNKSAQETRKAIGLLIKKEYENFKHPVKNIRGDGDKGFEAMKAYFPNINFYFTGSKFTYHNKLIDACMRTMRNALRDDNLWDGQHDNIIQQLVYYYNFTKHRAIGMKPIDMHSNIEEEWKYIRKKMEEVNDVKRKQIANGFYEYKPGDKLRLHLEYSKTNEKFTKRRRQYDVEAEFIKYVGGNCQCKITQGVNKDSVVEVPIYFTIKNN